MNKLIPLLAFSILLLVPGGLQAVYAGPVCETVASGDWTSAGPWSSGVPGAGCDVVINGGHTITINSVISHDASITIAIGGALIVDGPDGGSLIIHNTGDGTNNGAMTMIGGDSFTEGSFRNQGSFTNTCSGSMVFNGGTATNTGAFRNEGTATNSGIMTFNGGDGDRSGSLNNDAGSFTNHNTLVFNAGSGNDAGELIGSITEDPELCPVVGGELLPIDSTALILAGAQSFSWMIPVTLSVLGIGLFVVSRKS